jgi:hypothetical protein
MVEFGHGIGFVDVRTGKEFGPGISEHLLGGNKKMAVLFATASDVEKADENALRTDADGVIEIAGNALAGKHRCNVSSLDLRERRGRWLADYGASGADTLEQR